MNEETVLENEARHRESIERETARNQDITDIFVTNEQGKRVLGYLIEWSRAFEPCGDNIGDAQLSFDAGQRELVMKIFKAVSIGASGVMEKYRNHQETVKT